MSTHDDFEAYVRARWTHLVRSAVLMGSPVADAEALVQNVRAKVYANWRKVSRTDNPDAYVHRILMNTHVTARRRKWHGERPTEVLPERARTDVTDEGDTSDVVARCLQRLTPEHRAVVVLRHFAHLGEAEEIARSITVLPEPIDD
ncbi:sigma factor [Nocardioides yefusunii]|uniref:Sigma factor n=1 Tax=Nocardioides yefusunii TaxID=2500546 RepID=A0ABW1R2Z4_9ACTN|nr:sigma factor [Nocardioides yefusunii]